MKTPAPKMSMDLYFDYLRNKNGEGSIFVLIRDQAATSMTKLSFSRLRTDVDTISSTSSAKTSTLYSLKKTRRPLGQSSASSLPPAFPVRRGSQEYTRPLVSLKSCGDAAFSTDDDGSPTTDLVRMNDSSFPSSSPPTLPLRRDSGEYSQYGHLLEDDSPSLLLGSIDGALELLRNSVHNEHFTSVSCLPSFSRAEWQRPALRADEEEDARSEQRMNENGHQVLEPRPSTSPAFSSKAGTKIRPPKFPKRQTSR